MTRAKARKGCFGNAAQELVYDEAKLSVSLAKTSSHGFADLIVSARISREADDGSRTPAKVEPKVERYRLRYDGDAYRPGGKMPWWLAWFPPNG